MLVKIDSNRTLQGCKIETSIDREKQKSRYLLTSICGKYYTIWDNDEKKNIEFIGRRNFEKWGATHKYKPDF